MIPFTLIGCNNNNSSPIEQSSVQEENNITFNVDKVEVMEGDTFQLTYTYNKKTSALAFFSSRDSSIATVDDNGLITGVKAGTTNVSLMIGKETAFITVNVTKYTAKEDLSIDLAKLEYSLNVGDEFVLPIKARLGSKEVEATYTYVTDNSGVYEINNNTIKAIKAGTGELLIKASYESYTASLGIKVIVY